MSEEVTILKEPVRKIEVKVRVGKLRNCRAKGNEVVTGEMVKIGSKFVTEWSWKFYKYVL